jgi:AmpE protein
MVFIAILLALSLERYFDWGHLRRWQWFDRYCQLLSPYVDRFSPPLRLVTWIAPLVLGVGIIEFILSGWMYGFLRFLFDFIVLLYCFGPANFWAKLYDCLQAMQQGDPQLVDTRVKTAFPYIATPSSQALHQALVRAIFVEGNQTVFALVFWFAILGPMGAVLYRLTVVASNRATVDMASLNTRLLEALDWPPSRLLGLLFALGGHFVKVTNVWKKYALQGLSDGDVIIAETGVAALDWAPNKPLPENGEAEKAAIQLFDRALIIMLVLSAIVVLVIS